MRSGIRNDGGRNLPALAIYDGWLEQVLDDVELRW
jgi:hypothetical protein